MSELRLSQIALGFKQAADAVGLSKRSLQYAVNETDPTRRLKTVRVGGRRLIRAADLEDWFNRVAREDEEPQAA